jgi:hypothetical protein
VRQTPEPKRWNEDGLPWDQVVKGRLAVMDAFPAIKKAYMGVGGDPIQMNGLPTTDVVDMGNNYILRAQRVVIQQWKEDVPWAKKGQVTFGLGGSIAKEAGLLPGAGSVGASKVYTDQARKVGMMYPEDWNSASGSFTSSLPGIGMGMVAFGPKSQPKDAAVMGMLMVVESPKEFSGDDLYDLAVRSVEDFKGTQPQLNLTQIGRRPAATIYFNTTIEGQAYRAYGAFVAKGTRMAAFYALAPEAEFAKWSPTFEWMGSTIRFGD